MSKQGCDGFKHSRTGRWLCRNCHQPMHSSDRPVRECTREYELKRRRELGLDTVDAENGDCDGDVAVDADNEVP